MAMEKVIRVPTVVSNTTVVSSHMINKGAKVLKMASSNPTCQIRGTTKIITMMTMDSTINTNIRAVAPMSTLLPRNMATLRRAKTSYLPLKWNKTILLRRKLLRRSLSLSLSPRMMINTNRKRLLKQSNSSSRNQSRLSLHNKAQLQAIKSYCTR